MSQKKTTGGGRNASLHQAKKAKKDEFYTQLQDIANELSHYRKHFAGKTVFCNCDDPYESNFFKFFAMNFNAWGLKKLICTCYDGSPVAGTELELFDANTASDRKAYKVEITEVADLNGDGAVDLDDVELWLRQHPPVLLKENGDFLSKECIALLKEGDIVVTNPPFSLFREYVAQLVKYDKKFLIIGNINAITYKEIFPLIKENKLWIGYGFNLSMIFKTDYVNLLEANRKYVQQKGYNPDENYIKTPACCWFTNLSISKRNQPLDLYRRYTPEEYPKYDNYDAIEVGRVSDIPVDYDGVMGVPITFLDKYCPEQFEIVGIDGGDMGVYYGVGASLTKEECLARFAEHKGFRRGKLCYRDANGKLQMCYRRILIRKLKH